MYLLWPTLGRLIILITSKGQVEMSDPDKEGGLLETVWGLMRATFKRGTRRAIFGPRGRSLSETEASIYRKATFYKLMLSEGTGTPGLMVTNIPRSGS